MKRTVQAERDEKAWLTVEALSEKAEEGVPILVEGRRDVEALRRLGVKGRILGVKSGRLSLKDTARRIVEKLQPEEVILLMDFDRGGVKLVSALARQLEVEGCHPNLSFWVKLKALMGRQVKDVEGLASYLENVKKEGFHLLVELSGEIGLTESRKNLFVNV
ncbi:MAG: toprim domain-containing protein [Candidatus Hecatellaceae archaeon]|nr:MAG: hypothetical protein DRO43_03065 [Candidatus Hecatellales archaeon]